MKSPQIVLRTTNTIPRLAACLQRPRWLDKGVRICFVFLATGLFLVSLQASAVAGSWLITYAYSGSNSVYGTWAADGSNRNISFGWDPNTTTTGNTAGTITATLTWVGVPDNIVDPPPLQVPVRQSASAQWSVGVTSQPPRVWSASGTANNGLNSTEVKSGSTFVQSGLSKGIKSTIEFVTMGKVTLSVNVSSNFSVTSGNMMTSGNCSATVSYTVAVLTHAHPINYHLLHIDDIGNGTLEGFYAWDSSDGNLAHLSPQIDVFGEYVTYPGGNPYVPTNPPYDNWAFPNPTTDPWAPTAGHLEDFHLHSGFKTPYAVVIFTATQVYRFHCNMCMAAGEYEVMMGPHSIERGVVPTMMGNTWKYYVAKHNVPATLILP